MRTTADIYQTGSCSKRTFVHRFRGRTQRLRRLRFAARGGRATARAAARHATAHAARGGRQCALEAETNTKAARSSVYNLQSLGGGEWSSAHDSYRTAFMTVLMTA